MTTPVPPRYAPARPFPAYAYLPGRDPHPTGDPRGHSFGEHGPDPVHLPAERWRDNADWLFGCDLYNHGFLWEAHEAWEGLWHRAREDRDQADLLQGLIQCAAACLKLPMEQPRGRARLAEAGTAKLERVARARGGRHMGLELLDFVRDFRAWVAPERPVLDERPRLWLDFDA